MDYTIDTDWCYSAKGWVITHHKNSEKCTRMAEIFSRKSSRSENSSVQNLEMSDQKSVWIEVFHRFPGMSHWMGSFQIEKWKHSMVVWPRLLLKGWKFLSSFQFIRSDDVWEGFVWHEFNCWGVYYYQIICMNL